MPPTEISYHINLTTKGQTFADRTDGRRAGSSLLAAVEFMVRELDRPGGIAEMPLAREQLETFVLTQLLTPAELARVGSMSVRTLHATFHAELGISCMAYLRRLRLDHVRAELLRAGRSGVRVTDVAMRWGFIHPSRFAQQYRERFGELPSDTVKRYGAA